MADTTFVAVPRELEPIAARLFPEPSRTRSVVPLYAVLDGARDLRIYPAIVSAELDARCLFHGDLPIDLAAAAPHLIRLERGGSLARLVLEEGFGKSWAIFIESDAGIEALEKHLRKFLRVRIENRKGTFFFRFFDPRVLRTFLPTCEADQAAELFGDRIVSRFMLEDKDGALSVYARAQEDGSITHETVARAIARQEPAEPAPARKGRFAAGALRDLEGALGADDAAELASFTTQEILAELGRRASGGAGPG